eukprot:comp64517_c0_seq1/m.47968 comp64517_c0_seq1/g.47968  ORF comp64517_c0_seq1/g.47968 comp64517_c0_seq1/m.47968 type:complete len:279 (-) comp64517_c0_seq1:26-862(-)
MLYVVGLGLGDERDITVKGLEAVKGAKRVYLEAYTSILGVDKDRLEAFYGREVLLADRDFVEQGADEMLEGADTEDVVLLVVGDPFGATTHSDFVIRAREKNIPVQVVHNASIMNAVGCCGLQLYTYGEAVSIVFFTDDWRPDSFYDKIKYNRNGGLHTLCLLDIKVKEQSIENLIKGRKIYEPPRFMTINQAVDQLLEIEEKRGEKVYDEDTLCVGLARVGQPTQKIVAGRMGSMRDVDFGGPLHSFVIAGKCHDLELEALLPFALDRDYIKGLMKH